MEDKSACDSPWLNSDVNMTLMAFALYAQMPCSSMPASSTGFCSFFPDSLLQLVSPVLVSVLQKYFHYPFAAFLRIVKVRDVEHDRSTHFFVYVPGQLELNILTAGYRENAKNLAHKFLANGPLASLANVS